MSNQEKEQHSIELTSTNEIDLFLFQATEYLVRLQSMPELLKALERHGHGRAIYLMPPEKYSLFNFNWNNNISPTGFYSEEDSQVDNEQVSNTELLIGYILPCSEKYDQHLVIFVDGTMVIMECSFEDRFVQYSRFFNPNRSPIQKVSKFEDISEYIESFISFTSNAKVVAANFNPDDEEKINTAFTISQKIGNTRAKNVGAAQLKSLQLLAQYSDLLDQD